MFESVALENHLKPESDQGPSGVPSSALARPSSGVGRRVARVSVRDTSLPPVRSVIHWPLVQAWDGSRERRWVRAFWKIARRSESRAGFVRWSWRRRVAPSCIAEGQGTMLEEGVHRWSLGCVSRGKSVSWCGTYRRNWTTRE